MRIPWNRGFSPALQRLFILAILFGSVCVASGQRSDCVVSDEAFTDSATIHFRQSKVNVDPGYMGNGDAFEHINEMVEQYHQPDSNFVLMNVAISGGASPEGSYRYNQWLSKERASRILDYMDSRMMLPDSVTRQELLGRDWRGLRSMVMADPDVPNRDDVLAILEEIANNPDDNQQISDNALLRLKQLHGGVPYLYMYRHIFPSLRQANVVLQFGQLYHRPINRIVDIPEPSLIIDEVVPELTFVEVSAPPTDRPFYMALKSNMIADALALPELGVEFYLGKNLSIVGNWMYGWWDRDRTHRYWRAYGGDLALRWWFGNAAHNKPLTGHHLGVYGGVVTYDFEFGGKGHMGGRPGHNLWDRCMHYFGVEYGYSLPIARRFNIDFTLGLGYMGGKYVEYHPNGHCYQWDATKQKHWYGPTKLEVSIVWLIGHGNYNK